MGFVLLDSGFGIYKVGLFLRIHVSINPEPSEFRGQSSEATRDRRVRCMQSRKGFFGFGFRVLCFVDFLKLEFTVSARVGLKRNASHDVTGLLG